MIIVINSLKKKLISEILCPPPVVPLNGLLIEDSSPGRHVVGSVVQFSCGQKHQLIGKPSMVCTENGTWSHSTPYCEHEFAFKLGYIKIHDLYFI